MRDTARGNPFRQAVVALWLFQYHSQGEQRVLISSFINSSNGRISLTLAMIVPTGHSFKALLSLCINDIFLRKHSIQKYLRNNN